MLFLGRFAAKQPVSVSQRASCARFSASATATPPGAGGQTPPHHQVLKILGKASIIDLLELISWI